MLASFPNSLVKIFWVPHFTSCGTQELRIFGGDLAKQPGLVDVCNSPKEPNV